MKDIIFEALKSKGFIAPAANDISIYLNNAIVRVGPGSIAENIRDIDDIIYALTKAKESLIH